jgi:hypothetical protein
VKSDWRSPERHSPEEVEIARQRRVIDQTVPDGWAHYFNLLTYGTHAARGVGDVSPMYGVCGHGRVCLLTNKWHHPYPLPPCDKEPTMMHTGWL